MLARILIRIFHLALTFVATVSAFELAWHGRYVKALVSAFVSIFAIFVFIACNTNIGEE